MNNVYIHTKDNLKKIIIKYLIFLLPIIFYGIYKNGVLLYQKDLISFLAIFKVIYLILIGLFIDFIIRLIFKKKLHIDFDLLSVIIIPLFMPFNINILIYAGLLLGSMFIYELLSKLIKINRCAFIIFIILISNLLISSLNFLNPLEEANIYVFNTLDLLWGRNIGGMSSTSIIWGLVLLILGTIFNDYKWYIPLFSILFFLGIAFTFDINTNLYTNSMVIMALILVHIDTRFTPLSKLGGIIYGAILGIISYFLTIYLDYYYGVFVSILIISLIYEIVTFKNTKKYMINHKK